VLYENGFTVTLYATDILYNETLTPALGATITICAVVLMMVVLLMSHRYAQRDRKYQHVYVQSKRAFVQYISHGFREPLNAIGMSLKVLESDMRQLVPMSLKQPPYPAGIKKAISSGRIHSNLSSARGDSRGDGTGGRGPGSAGKSEENSMLSTTGLDSEGRTQEAINKLPMWLSVLEEMNESSNNASVLLSDILDYNLVENHLLVIDRDPVPVCFLITQIVDTMAKQAQELDLHMTLLFGTEPYRPELHDSFLVNGDKSKLAQVFRILLTHAIKHSLRSGDIDVMGK
jgi:signal transduction histidine kinase